VSVVHGGTFRFKEPVARFPDGVRCLHRRVESRMRLGQLAGTQPSLHDPIVDNLIKSRHTDAKPRGDGVSGRSPHVAGRAGAPAVHARHFGPVLVVGVDGGAVVLVVLLGVTSRCPG